MIGSSTPFSGRTLAWLIAVAVISFGVSVYLLINVDQLLPPKHSFGANAYSRSAIGHRAFTQTLRRLGIPVLVSRFNSRQKAGSNALLVLAEPDDGHPRAHGLQDLIQKDDPPEIAPWHDRLEELLGAPRILLVLSKRGGKPQPYKIAWVTEDSAKALRDRAWVEEVLDRTVNASADVVRPSGSVRWITNEFEVAPTLSQPQLMRSSQLSPIIAGPQGILLGELTAADGVLWILSDPDLIANHGLDDGDNAELAVRIIEALRPSRGPVIFDETIHGLVQEPNIWNRLFEPPLLFATLHALAALAALAWAGLGRFGAPRRAQPALADGKETLIRTMAGLLENRAHGRAILRGYYHATARDLIRQLHAPRHLDEIGLRRWLSRLGKSRGVAIDGEVLRADVEAASGAGQADAGRVLPLAERVHAWKQEMLNGPGRDQDS